MFSDDQCMMSQNHAWVGDPFKVQYRPKDFYVTESGSLLIWIQISHCN